MDLPPQSTTSTPVEGVPIPPPPTQKKAIPLKILYTERFNILDGKILPKQGTYNYLPAAVELLNAEEASNLKVDGGLANNSVVKVGCRVPKEIIVVVRPKSMATVRKQGQAPGADHKSILADELEMNLEVKLFDFAPPCAKISKAGKKAAKVVYSGTTKAVTKQNVGGLYCFSTEGNMLEHLFAQMGTYMFQFSLVDSKYGDVPPMVVRINVGGNQVSDNWAMGSSAQPLVPRKPKRSRERTSVLEPEVLDELPELYIEPPKKDITLVHVTTLDEVVSVNSFFAIAVFLGLAFSPPLPANQVATSLAPPKPECYVSVNTYRAVILWEVLSFSCFLFSTLVAHGFKLFIVLENGRDKDNSKSAGVDHRFLRFGIFASAMGSILGAIFLIVSMIELIEVRLGSITCGNPWAMRTTIPFVALGASGCGIFIVAVLYESCLD